MQKKAYTTEDCEENFTRNVVSNVKCCTSLIEFRSDRKAYFEYYFQLRKRSPICSEL